jgi:hypothetical protein
LIPVKKEDFDELLASVREAGAYLGVQDEAGEAAIYPADHFILIELPNEVEHALLEA